MCRLFGITNYEYSRHKDLLHAFLRLAETGRLLPGDPPGHTDGWGVGYYRGGIAAVYKSGGSLLAEQDAYESLLEDIGSSPVLIAHLRKSAWPGSSTPEHAHPFTLNNRIFAHNGTVRDYQSLVPLITAELAPAPSALDTEVFFRYILSLEQAGAAGALQESVNHIKAHNRYSALNCLFTGGRSLVACRDFSAHPDYYGLYHAEAGRSSVVCSEPLPGCGGWKLMDNARILVLPAEN